MKYLLSWGGGVNSTAIIAMHLLGQLDIPKEDLHIVFADTGAEKPETYGHVGEVGNLIAEKGYKVKVLRPWIDKDLYPKRVQNLGLTEHCYNNSVIPFRAFRWCTSQWKIIPITKYRKKLEAKGDEYKEIIGIAYDEKHRAKDHKKWYPLVEEQIDREGCKDLIKKANLPMPVKSGCWFCPYQRKSDWLHLAKEHPKLLEECAELERRQMIRSPKSKVVLSYNLPIKDQIAKWKRKNAKKCQQDELFMEYKCCYCE